MVPRVAPVVPLRTAVRKPCAASSAAGSKTGPAPAAATTFRRMVAITVPVSIARSAPTQPAQPAHDGFCAIATSSTPAEGPEPDSAATAAAGGDPGSRNDAFTPRPGAAAAPARAAARRGGGGGPPRAGRPARGRARGGAVERQFERERARGD